jgi:hypothetical protein
MSGVRDLLAIAAGTLFDPATDQAGIPITDYHFTLALGVVPEPGARRSSPDTFSPGTAWPELAAPESDVAQPVIRKVAASNKTMELTKHFITRQRINRYRTLLQ